MQSGSCHTTVPRSAWGDNTTASVRSLAAIAPLVCQQRGRFRAGGAPERLRAWVAGRPAATAEPAAAAKPAGTLLAEFADGPLEATSRQVMVVEGRPPKTIDIEFGGRTVRYCLAEWEQSGHSAIYGYLYDV